MTETTSEAFFEAKYRDAADPWDFATSTYELSRYGRILHALGTHRFKLAYEPGCSVGVLTEQLATRCAVVQACDISLTAVQKARERCRHLVHVHVQQSTLPEFVPQDADLYVFSEIGYYFRRPELNELLKKHTNALRDNALLIACHWRGESADHILSGDEVHEVIRGVPGLVHEYSEQHEEFRLDRWVKRKVEE